MKEMFKIDYVKIYTNEEEISKRLNNIRFALKYKKYNSINENLWYLSMFGENENLDCILKINKEKEIKFIKTKFELIEFLIYDCDDIESLFYYYNEIIKYFEYNDLCILNEILNSFVFRAVYDSVLYKSLLNNINSIKYLKLLEYVEQRHRLKRKHGSEALIKECIINNFNIIFPNYSFIKEEYEVKSIGKIDILAKDNISNRDIIIEIKKDTSNPNKQLLAYSKGFNNPILIGITNMNEKHYLDNIIYIKLKDILNENEIIR